MTVSSMNHTFNLRVISTGELIIQEETPFSLLVWQRRAEKKVLKSQRRAERFKEAILNKDTLPGWVDYDEYARSVTLEELHRECKRLFKGYSALEKQENQREKDSVCL